MDEGYTSPVLMQFDAIEDETGYVVSTVTNARVRHTLDQQGKVPHTNFEIRDSTIKAALLNPNSVEKEDIENPYRNDLDKQSRPFKQCPPPLPI